MHIGQKEKTDNSQDQEDKILGRPGINAFKNQDEGAKVSHQLFL